MYRISSNYGIPLFFELQNVRLHKSHKSAVLIFFLLNFVNDFVWENKTLNIDQYDRNHILCTIYPTFSCKFN